MAKEEGTGMVACSESTVGSVFVSTLTDCLWYIDGHHHGMTHLRAAPAESQLSSGLQQT